MAMRMRRNMRATQQKDETWRRQFDSGKTAKRVAEVVLLTAE